MVIHVQQALINHVDIFLSRLLYLLLRLGDTHLINQKTGFHQVFDMTKKSRDRFKYARRFIERHKETTTADNMSDKENIYVHEQM